MGGRCRGWIDRRRKESHEPAGRGKEAAGALTGDEKLKREGRIDQSVGKLEQKAGKVIDRVKAP